MDNISKILYVGLANNFTVDKSLDGPSLDDETIVCTYRPTNRLCEALSYLHDCYNVETSQ